MINTVSQYDARSLQHERRMLAAYRRGAKSDAAQLQPLANACWRAAAFEWALHRDADTVRELWGEGSRALAQGFARRRVGFDAGPGQLILGLDLALAAGETDALRMLAYTTLAAAKTPGGRWARAKASLAEGYALVARAVIARECEPAGAGLVRLHAARVERELWERQFPGAREAAWGAAEYDAICSVLETIARAVAGAGDDRREAAPGDDGARATMVIPSLMDETLLRLEQFVEADENHHPKLYVWLPGIALSALMRRAGLPTDWLETRQPERDNSYRRLPIELLQTGTPAGHVGA